MAFYTYAENPIGAFYERETGNYFEFSENPEFTLAPPAHGGKNMRYPHRVWVGGRGVCGMTGWRYAKVGKTVVHIITDEDDRGLPVIEKWYIKNYRTYGQYA